MDDEIVIGAQGCDTITLDSINSIDISSIDLNTMASGSYTISNVNNLPSGLFGNYSNPGMGNITISNGSSGSFLTSGVNGTSWSTIGSSSSSSLQVQGDANFEGDVKIKGVSIAKALEDIQKRLAILVPDPAKLEHFAALKKAYEHYKTLEALCELPKEDNGE